MATAQTNIACKARTTLRKVDPVVYPSGECPWLAATSCTFLRLWAAANFWDVSARWKMAWMTTQVAKAVLETEHMKERVGCRWGWEEPLESLKAQHDAIWMRRSCSWLLQTWHGAEHGWEGGALGHYFELDVMKFWGEEALDYFKLTWRVSWMRGSFSLNTTNPAWCKTWMRTSCSWIISNPTQHDCNSTRGSCSWTNSNPTWCGS